MSVALFSTADAAVVVASIVPLPSSSDLRCFRAPGRENRRSDRGRVCLRGARGGSFGAEMLWSRGDRAERCSLLAPARENGRSCRPWSNENLGSQ